MVRKLVMGAFLAGALVIASLLPLQAAQALPPETDVTGVITSHGNPVVGATVTVTCRGFVRTDTTDANGSYLVSFTTAQCPFGSTVKVMAKKGTMTGSSSGTVQGITTKLNIAVVNVSIPEYGWLGGLIAAGTGVGAIAYTRRRSA